MRWILKFAGVCAALCGVTPVPAIAAAADSWQEVDASGYTVLSQLDERSTRRWVAYFDQFVGALTSTLDLRNAELPPLTVLLFDKQSDLLAAAPMHGDACGAGHHGPHVLAFAADAPPAEAMRGLFHAGAHWMTAAAGTRQPGWFDEGLAQLFASFGLKGMQAHWGDSLEEAVALVRKRGAIPMDAFLTSHGGGMEPALYHAQSLVVAHWLLLGRTGAGHDELRRYLAAWHARGDEAELPAASLTPGLLDYVAGNRFDAAFRPRQVSERRYVMAPADGRTVGDALTLLGALSGTAAQAFNAP